MNEYTFFEAAGKAKPGETLQNVERPDDTILKTHFNFYWKTTGRNVSLHGDFLKEKWIIVEEVERQQSEKKLRDFVQGLTSEELKLLSVKIDVEFVERTKPK